ncbi:MAG: hypothetical protein RLZZ502_818 [Pseudomonadota bacterium]|jgi:two-component system response regulator BaeR
MSTVLIIEDDVKIAELLRDYLLRAQMQVHCAHDGVAGWAQWQELKPECILLDVNLPKIDGLSLCRQIRQHSQVPILMVTARADEIDRLLGLELGADDYICKPFSPREVVARVQAVLRRTHAGMQTSPNTARWQWWPAALKVALDQCKLPLTPVEFRLLWQLYQAQGRILSRTQLLDSSHEDFRDSTDRAVDSHIRNLRKKMLAITPSEDWIRSVYGMGYAFEHSPQAAPTYLR